MAGLAVMFVIAGCATSSGSSVSTYEYDGGARPTAEGRPVETEREQDISEYEMVSPGQMVVEPR